MQPGRLTSIEVQRIIKAKKWGAHSDGGNLYLVGSETFGTFSWQFRFKSPVLNKERWHGLGPFHTFTLSEARERATQCRKLVADGRDPIEEKRKQRDANRVATAERITFKDAALRWHALLSPTWRNKKHRAQIASDLERHAYRLLGDRPALSIDGAMITETLEPIWTKTPVTASRLKMNIKRIIQWVRDGQPLPRQGARKRVKHHTALAVDDMPTFMAELRARDSVSARALEFTILTAGRTGEALGAKWDEINLKTGVWTVPADRMKAGKKHRVPLSRRALAILKALPEIGEYVFPGWKTGAPLSNMAMLELLRGMRGDGNTVHGFRSTFRDWAGDRTHHAREVIEHALAHQISDEAEAAYRRGDALEKRKRLMDDWAKFCESTPVAAVDNVMPISGVA